MCKEYCGIELNFCHYTASNDRGTLLYEVAEKHSPFASVLAGTDLSPEGKAFCGTPALNKNCSDETFDGTDAACPAWWRGHYDGSDSIVKAVNEMLDSFDSGKFNIPGKFVMDSLNELRLRLANLYTKKV